MSPTVTSAGSVAGVILGTAPYMSPEQTRGRSVDRRTDIWSFGCVMFEMLTGRQTFAGESTTDVLASIVKEEPAWDRLPVNTPPPVRRLLQRRLAKDPRQRLRDIGDARLDLESSFAGREWEKTVPEVGTHGTAVLALRSRLAAAGPWTGWRSQRLSVFFKPRCFILAASAA